jgi:hypothetical protein
VEELFESIKRALSYDTVDNIINFAHEQTQFFVPSLGKAKQVSENDHLSKK